MKKAILIIGGTGTVGKVIASHLALNYSEQLIIAGRSETRATEAASQLGTDVRWRILDVSKPLDYDQALAHVGWVVMCLDLPEIEFVRQCFWRGIHYVDISAEYPILSAISGLDDIARQHGATAILSVGLVPGVSNLMARHSLQFIEPIKRFDTAVLQGLGEKHGVGASSWVMSHMNDEIGMTYFEFHEPFNKKPVYRFAFSDQYTLIQTLPIDEAATWLGFDPSPMTHLLIGLPRLPILRHLFHQQSIQQILLNITQRWQFGRDDFVLTTRACGDNGIYQAWLHGQGEAQATGLVTAEVVRRIVDQQFKPGVFHIEQLFQLEDVLPLLEQYGVTFTDTAEAIRTYLSKEE